MLSDSWGTCCRQWPLVVSRGIALLFMDHVLDAAADNYLQQLDNNLQ